MFSAQDQQPHGAEEKGRDLAGDIFKGTIAGAAGWWAMDHVLRFLYNHEDPSVRGAEDAARGGVPALEVLAEKIATRAGISLSTVQREKAGTVLQWVEGIGTGIVFGVLRGRAPTVGAGRGLAFGAGVSLLVDEGMVPLLDLSPGPTAFPWQTHARGFLGHLVYGLVADVVLDVLNR